MKKILVAGCIDLENYKMKLKQFSVAKLAHESLLTLPLSDELAFNPSQMDFIRDWLNNIRAENKSHDGVHDLSMISETDKRLLHARMQDIFGKQIEPRVVGIFDSSMRDAKLEFDKEADLVLSDMKHLRYNEENCICIDSYACLDKD